VGSSTFSESDSYVSCRYFWNHHLKFVNNKEKTHAFIPLSAKQMSILCGSFWKMNSKTASRNLLSFGHVCTAIALWYQWNLSLGGHRIESHLLTCAKFAAVETIIRYFECFTTANAFMWITESDFTTSVLLQLISDLLLSKILANAQPEL